MNLAICRATTLNEDFIERESRPNSEVAIVILDRSIETHHKNTNIQGFLVSSFLFASIAADRGISSNETTSSTAEEELRNVLLTIYGSHPQCTLVFNPILGSGSCSEFGNLRSSSESLIFLS